MVTQHMSLLAIYVYHLSEKAVNFWLYIDLRIYRVWICSGHYFWCFTFFKKYLFSGMGTLSLQILVTVPIFPSAC